jgi:hypothetical protein
MWDNAKAVEHVDDNAEDESIGECARYVREAVEAGGVTLIRHGSAKDYGPSLIAVGFEAMPATAIDAPEAGDVGVVQPIPGHPNGHMAMFDGKLWVSDFEQMHGLYPNAEYRTLKPPVTIYRFPA